MNFEELKLLAQGAEGKIYSSYFLSRPAIIKERLSKSYRVKELDAKINKHRLQQEVRSIAKCRRAGVPTPIIYHVDMVRYWIVFECINGKTLKDFFYNLSNMEVAKLIGQTIGKMHDADVTHGDLTTSNMMLHSAADGQQQVVLIDFGLSGTQPTNEDKAVDLYVLERAFVSTHPGSDALVQEIMDTYRFSSRRSGPVLQRLEQVRLRGRKRDMCG